MLTKLNGFTFLTALYAAPTINKEIKLSKIQGIERVQSDVIEQVGDEISIYSDKPPLTQIRQRLSKD